MESGGSSLVVHGLLREAVLLFRAQALGVLASVVVAPGL